MIARGTAILCFGLLIAKESYAIPQQPQLPGTRPAQPQTLLSPDELNSLVAPVALYPDPILSQVLVASTYPVEIVEAARWLEDNSNLSGKALAEAAAEQPWDASVQALVLLPEVLNRLDEELRWTTELGNAFLAQEQDVMDAVQRMREKAWASGALRSTPQQTVSTIYREQQTLHRDTAGIPRDRLCTGVQPGRRLGFACISIPCARIPAITLVQISRRAMQT